MRAESDIATLTEPRHSVFNPKRYLIFLAFTVCYSVAFGLMTRLDWGALAAGYLGLILLGAAFLALGLFASSLTENQIIAG